jgi:hypothetical protein
MATMTRAQRIRLIQKDLRIARAECKHEMVLQLIEELAMVCRGEW